MKKLFTLLLLSSLAQAAGEFHTPGGLITPTLQLTTSPISGYVLTSDGIGNATWQAPTGGGGGGGGGACTTNTVSTSFTVPTLLRCYLLNVNTTASVRSVTLPDALASNGFCVDVKNIGTATNAVTMLTQSSQTIDGQSTDSVDDQNDTKHYCAVSGNWFNY
jgi:hypothetical protein